jgi:hypothetical protein
VYYALGIRALTDFVNKRRETGFPERRLKKLGTPVYIAPGKATEDRKGGTEWQELPE